MSATVVLVTGGNRGLGLGTVKRFLALPDHIVVAAVRDPSHPTAQALSSLPKGAGSRVLAAQYDAGVRDSPAALVQELQSAHGISHVDIVVANAAILKDFPLVKDAKYEDLVEHYQVNVLGVVALYQATRDLLHKSTREGLPQFVIMGSGAGALGRQPAVPNAVYGPTKAAVAWYGVRLNAEDEWLNTYVIDPGFVQTDGGNFSAKIFGMEEAPLSADESGDGTFNVMRTATKERYGGKVVLYTGEVQVY